MIVDAEQLAVAWLASQFPDAQVSTVLDEEMAGNLPAIRVGRVAGPSTFNIDYPRLDLDVFDNGRGAAKQLAHRVRASVQYAWPASGQIARPDDIVGPLWAPWEVDGVDRFVVTVAFAVRSLSH